MSDEKSGTRTDAQLSDGVSHGLRPLRPLDLQATTGFWDLLQGMKHTSFGGRQLGNASDVLLEMVQDPDCFVVGTFTGAMTVAKQGLVLCDMIDHGMLDAIVCTGALMAHGFVEAAGMTHFAYDPSMSDNELYYAGFDRVYDTLELEKNLDDVEEIFKTMLRAWPADQTCCSWTLMAAIGRWLHDNVDNRAILASAYLKGVPVYIPAFTDSELGLDFALHNRRLRMEGTQPLAFDPFLDLEDYTERIRQAKRIGIFTIGGGVPRNWAQQVGPYLDIIEKRGVGEGQYKRFQYAVRICPEPVHWGGLSGCTYSEGVSWGKFVPKSEGGRHAEVPSDATIAWPILVKGVLERMQRD